MAEALGIGRVICPRASGVLSALGLAAAGARCDAARTVMLSGAGLTATRVAAERDTLIEQATRALGDAAQPRSAGDGELTGAAVEVRVQYELRYRGQAFELAVAERECPDPEQMAAAFARAHRERYGYAEPEAPIELVTIRVSAFTAGPQLGLAAAGGVPCVRETRTVVIEGAAVKAQWLTGDPAAGTSVQGPAVFAMPQTTLLIPPGWNAQVDAQGSVTLDWVRPKRAPRRAAHREGRPDAVGLQVLCGALRATCEEMGAVLIRAAHSANIKERRDASTALFDADGQMVMQAEHIPVHLGAMPDAVAAVLAEKHRPGRSFILNDPFAGGTHLPDITVVTPVFCAEHLVGFAASRAHHADVGGRWPGSMPADSHTLQEEGVVISPQPITPDTIDRLVGEMRQPAERRADLRAQLAANTVGADRYAQLAQDTGIASLRAGTDAVLDYAERRTVACLRRLEGAAPGALPDTPLRDGNGAATWQAADVLETADGDLQLRLRATITGGRLVLDFAGSAPQHEGNLNCPAAVTRSACYFAMRVLTDPDIPPSAGAHRPIEVRAPLGSLLNAHPGAAVAAGNVETSSRVADLVLGAFGCALGQGTMNNLTLGNDHFTYYETVGGGQGACADADGPSAVHVAMSNTLNTPVEALERDFPMRVRRYEVRRGSGGSGKHSGGDGVVREIEALEPMRYSLIGERRRHAPRGAAGGGDGACGRNLLLGAATTGGEEREPEAQVLPAKATGTLAAGERLVAETPGGGGYGRAC
jgi:N-methylhydantoinase B